MRALFLALLALCLSTRARADIIINGDFETGLMGPWFTGLGAGSEGFKWHVTTDNPHSGLYSASDIGNKELRQNFDPVWTGTIDHITFWIDRPGSLGTIPLVPATFYYDDGTFSYGALFGVTAEDWTMVDMAPFLLPNKLGPDPPLNISYNRALA
jgi:hypothetical protein